MNVHNHVEFLILTYLDTDSVFGPSIKVMESGLHKILCFKQSMHTLMKFCNQIKT